MKAAIVHDYLNQYGGAERVLERLHQLFPAAPIYTSIFDERAMPASYRQMDIRTSFMQRLPGVKRHHQPFLPLYPLAFENFDLSDYDLVLSNSSAWAKGVVAPPGSLHICYCLTPMRWVWNYHDYVRREQLGGVARLGLPILMNYLRVWDLASSSRVDEFVAISRAVANRIRAYYRREAAIIYPPVETSAFVPAEEHEEFYLVVSRLVPYKRIDLVVEACGQLGRPLKVVGSGRDEAALRARAGQNVEFLGHASEAELAQLYARCRALIFPGQEDFGIVPLEAQSAGRPVIAFKGGGALETVVEDKTGVMFWPQSVAALVEAMERFEALSFDPVEIRAHAEQFDTSVFMRRLADFVERAYATRGSEPQPSAELTAV